LHHDPERREADADGRGGGVSEAEERHHQRRADQAGQDDDCPVHDERGEDGARQPADEEGRYAHRPRCEPLDADKRDVCAGVEPGERESHALKQHREDGPEQPGRDRDQPDEPSIRALSVATQIGGVALAIDAKDDRAASWYERFGASRLLDDPLKLILPLGTIADAVAAAERKRR
jgi:hypothetical protein